ncbi:hypothetical protein ScPMuIL_003065 [Solemya velum]
MALRSYVIPLFALLLVAAHGAKAQDNGNSETNLLDILFTPIEDECDHPNQLKVVRGRFGASCKIRYCLNYNLFELPEPLRADRCCNKFGKNCMLPQCETKDTHVTMMEGFCANCTCSSDRFWECPSVMGPEECCRNHGYLCECYGDGTSIEVIGNDGGCRECTCVDRKKVCSTKIISREKCCLEHQKNCPTCCSKKNLRVETKKTASVHGGGDGIHLLEKMKCDQSRSCSCGMVLEFEFEPLMPLAGCAKEPLCGRRQLHFEFTLGNLGSGVALQITDSRSSPASGGTADTSAQIVIDNKEVYLHYPDWCNDQTLKKLKLVSLASAKRFAIYAGNQFVRIEVDGQLIFEECSSCLFELNNPIDNRLFVAINRPVNMPQNPQPEDTGQGICSGKARFTCPGSSDWAKHILRYRNN